MLFRSELGVELKPENIICGEWKFDNAKQEAAKLFDRDVYPTAMTTSIHFSASEKNKTKPEQKKLQQSLNNSIIKYHFFCI